MGIRAFGAIGVEGPGGAVPIAGARERAVLGLLVARVGRVVADDVFVDELWEADADPVSARKSLRVRISRIRRPLAACGAAIEHVAGGYRLLCPVEEVDVERFRAAARGAMEGVPAERITAADQALAEWSDEPFAELRYVDGLDAVRSELAALRRDVIASRAHACVDVGDAPAGVDLVLAAVAERPDDEALVRASMRALAATGRSVEALEVYRLLADILADRGLEPSPLTREFEEKILTEVPIGTSSPSTIEVRRAGVPSWRRPVGRDGEIETLARLVSAERLVTVLGPGGVGKTRIAAAVAAEIEQVEDVWWIALRDVGQGTDVAAVIAEGIGARPHRSDLPEDSVAAYIGARRALLVLDGVEHLAADVAGVVRTLLDVSPGLKILTTSQAPLRDVDERRHRLVPLEVPSASTADPASLETNPAVRLFVETAERIGAPRPTGLASVAALVRALDGLPLAIELAAAQSDLHSVDELRAMADEDLQRLDASVGAGRLVGSASWSIGLLDPVAREFLEELACIPNGFSAALGAEVGSHPDCERLLRTLVDRSLVEASQVGDAPRLHLLGPIRSVLVVDGVDDGVRDRHVRAVVDWIDDIEGLDAAGSLAFVRRELHHFVAAFEHAATNSPNDAIRLAQGLSWFWGRHGDWAVGAHWYEVVLGMDAFDASDPDVAMPVLMSAGVLSLFAGRQPDRAAEILDRLDQLAVESNRPRPFNGRSLVHSYRGDYRAAMELIEAQIDQDARTGANSATPLANLAHLHVELGDLETATELVERSKAEAFRHGSQDVSHTGLIEAQIHLAQGRIERCRAAAGSLLADWRQLGANLDHQVNLLHILALAALEEDDVQAAARSLEEANEGLRLVDRDLPHHLLLVGEVARRSGRLHEADALAAQAVARLGTAEQLFPSRRRFLPEDTAPAPSRPRHELLRLSADILRSVIER